MFYRLNQYKFIYSSVFIISMLIFYKLSIFLYAQHFFDSAISCIASPLLRAQQYAVNIVQNYKSRHKKYGELEALVEKLGAEKEQLISQLIALQVSVQFEEDTHELQQFQKRFTAYEKRLTQILFRQFSPEGHFFLVDVGTKHGIEVDMIAVYKNCLVGRVVQVYPYHSRIALITDRNCKVATFCAHTKTAGIYEGINQTESAALTHVNHLDRLEKDDLIISSGLGLVFPRGFGLGKIRYIEQDGAHYYVRLVPLIDLKNMTYCYLMKKGEE